MAFPEETTMLELIVLLTWACLSTGFQKNALHSQFFFSKEVLHEICSAASLTFCPGLWEVIQATSPPTVKFFKNLPKESRGRWAVYALVLEKPGAIGLVYIGSGTAATGGVRTRWGQYDRLDWGVMPEYVIKAIRDGYKITSKGTLVTCPIPSAGKLPRTRLLFIAMEAAISFLFWAMKSRKADHKMIGHCPWPLKSFSYEGLCSHNPLIENVMGNFDLSPEQLEAIAAAVKENQRLWYKSYMASEHGKQVRRNAQATFRQSNPEKKQANYQRSHEKTIDSKKFFCTTCGVACKGPWELTRHNASRRHKTKAAKVQKGVVMQYRCKLCDFSHNHLCGLERHKLGKRHLAKVAAIAAAKSSS